ncbi:TolC family protein [bacterium]|nr:TolC family protein [bacterium]
MKQWTLWAMIFIAVTPISAQEKKAIDIDEAVKIAMKNNIQVISAQNNYNSTVAAVLPKTWGQNLPTISANANYSHTMLNAVNARADSSNFGQFGSPKSNSYSYSLNANYVIFDGLKRYDEMSRARIDESSARFDYENTRQEVTLNVYESYINVLKNQQLLKIAEENLKRSEEQLKRLEERNRLGAQILSDVYKQRVQVGSDKLALNRAKNNLRTSKASLNNLIGEDVNTEFELKELSLDVSFDSKQFDFMQSYETALESRKDYLASKKKVESTRRSLSIAKSGYFPTLSAVASYNWNNTALNFKDYNNQDNASIGLNLSIPIFTGFQTNTGVVQADQRYQTERSNLETTKRKVALDIKIALLNMQTSYENVKLSEENVKSAKEDLRLATERYNLGAGTVLDQITANTGYSTAEANYTQSIYDFIYARQQYFLAVGILGN